MTKSQTLSLNRIFFLCVFFLPVVVGCDRSEQPGVTVYVSADERVARPIIAAFEEQTGIDANVKFDTEATKSTGLANDLRAEADNPRADVFWSSEVFLMIQLAEEGILAAHESELTENWPDNLHDSDELWHGFASRARVIVYAPDRVAEHEVPETWMNFTRDWWKDRIVMADPRFGTTRGHMGAMKAYWDRRVMPGYYDAFLQGLAANNMQLLTSGNAGVVRAVASGEADAGMTDTDDVWAAIENGADLAWIYPRHAPDEKMPGGGTLLIPNTVARIKGGPHPKEAAALIDFLLSAQVERMLAESHSHNVPSREDLAREFAKYAVPDPLDIDLTRAAGAMDEAVDLAMQRFGERGE